MIVLGIAGFARAGKDTFVSIAKEILLKNGYEPHRVAFADTLKQEVDGMLRDSGFKTYVYTTNTDDKTLLRPLLVWWGCQRRRESEGGLYWVKQVNKEIQETFDTASHLRMVDINRLVFLVSDVRFPNESSWVKYTHFGEVIHLKRYTKTPVEDRPSGWPAAAWLAGGFDIEFDPAPNDEELRNDPLVIEMADQKVEWENRGNLPPEKAVLEPYLRDVVFDTLNKSRFFNGSLQK